MKTGKIVTAIGSIALAAAMGITGCSVVRADEVDPEFEQEFGTAMLGDGEYRSILLQV